jgi:cytochrome oxidase Cu insertion factor (SCO1/SenC/PrrC family)
MIVVKFSKKRSNDVNKKINFSIVMICFLVLFLFACTQDKTGEQTKGNSTTDDLMAGMNIQHIAHPTTAPDFELLSVQGEKVSLSQYRGKVVLLSFWATW